MADAIKVGDIVQLKSGGPKMTVEGKNFDGDFICSWFGITETAQTKSFAEASLKRIEE